MSVPSCPLFLWSLKSALSSNPAVSHCLAGQSGATPVISLRLGFDVYILELTPLLHAVRVWAYFRYG